MSSQLSTECDAMPLAVRDATVKREFRLLDLPRLADLAPDDAATARLTAKFHLIEKRVSVAGRAQAHLLLVCQRCLGPVRVLVDDEFHVILVASEVEADQLSEDQDAVVADVARLELGWLLEEQLLLAMPLVPLHAQDDCAKAPGAVALTQAKAVVTEAELSSAAAQLETQRPFADLRELLNRRAKGRSNPS